MSTTAEIGKRLAKLDHDGLVRTIRDAQLIERQLFDEWITDHARDADLWALAAASVIATTQPSMTTDGATLYRFQAAMARFHAWAAPRKGGTRR